MRFGAEVRRYAIPLLLSAAVHGAVLLFLLTRPPPPPPTNYSAPLEIDFIAPPPSKSAPFEVFDTSKDISKASKDISKASKDISKKAVKRRDPQVVRKVVPAVVAEPQVEKVAPADDAPRDVPLDAPKRLVTLTPSVDSSSSGGSDFPVIVRQVPDQLTPDQLVSNLVKDSIARGKVDRGLVHPYFQDLGKALLKKWDADRAVSRNGLKGFAEQALENNREWTKVWQSNAAVYGASGSPLGKEEYLGPERPIVGDPQLAARRQLAMKMREQFRTSRRALFRVTQDRDGMLLSVELIQPSNDETVDREAMEDVRNAASALPPPPSDVVGNRKSLVSIWQFELIISISPPVPSFSFEFDEALKFVDARLPLDRRIYKKVKLVSAD